MRLPCSDCHCLAPSQHRGRNATVMQRLPWRCVRRLALKSTHLTGLYNALRAPSSPGDLRATPRPEGYSLSLERGETPAPPAEFLVGIWHMQFLGREGGWTGGAGIQEGPRGR